MTEYLGYLLINYSFLVLSVAERFLLLSLVGMVLVMSVARAFKSGAGDLALMWFIYLAWLLPASTPLLPGLPHVWLGHLGLENFSLTNPCASLPLERLGNIMLPAAPFFSLNVCLFLFWCAIAGILLTRLVLKRRHFMRIASRACDLQTTELYVLLGQLRMDYAIKTKIRLCSSAEYQAPFTLGCWRPVVFIPEAMLQQLDRPTLKIVLAHELAHIKRRDDLYIMLQHILRALFFFNPLIRFADRKLSESREMCCDHLAVKYCGISPREYGRGLLRVLEHFRQPLIASVPVAGFLSHDIGMRIHALIHPYPPRQKSFAAIAITVLGLLGISLVFGGITHEPAHLLEEKKAREALAHLQPVAPLPGGVLISGIDLMAPLGCHMPGRDVYHTGIDLQPPSKGAPVVAFAAGKVINVTTLPAHVGKLVRIQHPGDVVSTYVRLDTVSVAVGDRLMAGQPFATVGATAHTDHMHFEVTRDQQIINPMFLLH